MKVMRTPEQWQTIIQEQQSSGLTIIDYCRQHQLSMTSFYAVRKKLGLSACSFVRAKITQQVEIVEEQPGITLTVGKANVSLPATTSATYLSQLLREFA
ncbi:IS66 family insertion sequence element accessory protein TnpA [Thalassomonas sp. M1454]|uniref:IS66 family insertion sequence element accessory protein TnpA n=1 Tax=Thalassomonas sp. M1454 TaxID=2594477 RepID=UPI00117EF9A4|nr:IS66 family insertion sequence element accessory protein TnpB [Thalassomonas sp. M1454]TRX57184.1 IS66 family insertion sequence element accessory protein TnpB [Thalassomonas sp. M1454]